MKTRKISAEPMHLLAYLHGELPRGTENQSLRDLTIEIDLG